MSRPEWTTEPLSEKDLSEVLAIERASFPNPWPAEGFIRAEGADWQRAVVLRDRRRPAGVRGYICYWVLEREMEIQNLAVHPEDRRRGGASHLLGVAMADARRHGCLTAWLEVRPTNEPALALYREWGFEQAGRRRRYYEDGEDALLMSAPVKARGRSLKGPRSG